MSPVTKPSRPTAATRISAAAQTSFRFFVLEWQIVTVAFFASSSSAAGFAHDVRAANDDGVLARNVGARGLDHADAARRGAGQVARLADLHTAHVDGREAVHVLLRAGWRR